uniref:Uncharacterized protein n=1 Tax=Salmo trutta TaxID=8032 RepID=A0A674CJW6_SALTR
TFPCPPPPDTVLIDKARAIIDMVLNKGTFACLTMKTLLCELDQCLSSELGLN